MSPKTPIKKIKGTPLQIGQAVTLDVVMPIIKAASEKMSQQDMAQMYCGIIAAIHGGMIHDLGKEKADEVMSTLTDVFKAMADPMGRAPAHNVH